MQLKVIMSLVMLSLTGCGGSDESDDPGSDSGATTYDVGGVVNSLNGDLRLLVSKNSAPWETKELSEYTGDTVSFYTSNFESGTKYSFEIESQPQGQTCEIINGSGTVASSDVINVEVNCIGDSITILTGVFLDSAVENIDYTTETMSGTTNENGEYSYAEGESVTFSIGSVTLPIVVAEPIITPLELANSTEITNPTVVNITRLLQSLDQDGDPSNGIMLNDLAKSSANSFIDFTMSIAEFESSPDVLSLLINAGQDETITALKDLHEAILHFEETLISLTEKDLISFAGTWRLTESYDICSGSLTAHYSTITLGYNSGTYTFNQNFIDDIALGGDSEGSLITHCSLTTNDEEDENDTFVADELLSANDIKLLLDDSEVRSVIINSPDQFTVTLRFYTGLHNEYGIDVTQIWKRQ